MDRRPFGKIAIVAAALCSILPSLAAEGSDASLGCDGGIQNVEMLQLEKSQILILGEIHGTEESPQFALRLACQALAHGQKVAIGLEAPAIDQERLDRYTTTSQISLVYLADARLWNAGDGRSSRAVLALINDVRDHVLRGHNIRIFAFDGPKLLGQRTASEPLSRDQRMADNVRQEYRESKGGIIILLTGNVHAAKQPLNEAYPKPMASYLADLPLVSLRMRHRGGTFWACVDSCEVNVAQSMSNSSPGFSVSKYENRDQADTFDAFYDVGLIHASYPFERRDVSDSADNAVLKKK